MTDRTRIDRARVEHVARLASLSLDPGEVDAMVTELDRIVGYVDQLGELDTEGVPAMTGGGTDAAPPSNLRPDEVKPGLTHAEALAQAPRVASGGFAVPRFLDAPKAGR